MKKTGIIIAIVLIILAAVVVGGWLVTIGWALFKILIGLLGLGLFVLGFYLGRLSKKS